MIGSPEIEERWEDPEDPRIPHPDERCAEIADALVDLKDVDEMRDMEE